MNKRFSVSRVIKILLYLIYLNAAVFGIAYLVFWQPFVANLPRGLYDIKTIKHVDQETYLQLGSIVTGDDRQESHFTYFEKEKPQGTIRICALGDSFTAGSETGRRHDYPSYLQRQFEAAGVRNVQVINFANAWYGFSQTMIMWESVASGFDCDFVLLMPFAFWSKRDTTFNHTDLRAPDYFHGRYILDGNGIRLIPVIGDGITERFEAYFSFFPKWTYLRYDRNQPMIIQSMLPQGKTIENWFYYDSRTALEESLEIYEKLANKMADTAKHIIIGLFAQSSDINEPMQRVQRPNVSIISSNFPSKIFPYHSPIAHHSAWGNELIARLYFAALTGEVEGGLNTIEIKEFRSSDNASHETVPLHDYDSIILSIDEHSVGSINPVEKMLARKYEGRFHETFKNSEVVSLLALKARGMGLADACLIPLNFRPDEGVSVHLQPLSDATSVEIGEVYYPNPNINIAVSEIDTPRIDCWGKGLRLAKNHQKKMVSVQNTEVRLVLGNETILTGRADEEYLSFERTVSPYKFRALGDYLVQYDQLASSGTIYIVLQQDEIVTKEPLFVWQKKKDSLIFQLANQPPSSIVIKDGQAYVNKILENNKD